jgi:hypothetical protein
VVAAGLTIGELLDPERAARLVEQKALDPSLPGLDDVLDAVVAQVRTPGGSPYEAEIARAVERGFAERLMGLAAAARMPQVRALAVQSLEALARQAAPSGADRLQAAHAALLAQDVRRFLERPASAVPLPAVPQPPPGPPIGEPALDYLRGLELEPWCSRVDGR